MIFDTDLSPSTEDFYLDLGREGRITARHYAPVDTKLGVTYILAPGARLGHDCSFITNIASRLAKDGLDVVTFNFPFHQKGSIRPDGIARLEHCCQVVMDCVVSHPPIARQPIIAGGTSMGGRVMSVMASRPNGLGHMIAGLAFLGYPLHPPQRPEQLFVWHFADIKVPMLFIQGTRDPFGTPEQLKPPLAVLDTPVTIYQVISGDHSLRIPRTWRGDEDPVLDKVSAWVTAWVQKTIAPDLRICIKSGD